MRKLLTTTIFTTAVLAGSLATAIPAQAADLPPSPSGGGALYGVCRGSNALASSPRGCIFADSEETQAWLVSSPGQAWQSLCVNVYGGTVEEIQVAEGWAVTCRIPA